MRIFDDIFDQRYLNELTHRLKNSAWYPNNIANRYTWPYGEKGSHKLLGDIFFQRESLDIIHYSETNKALSFDLINAYYAIQKRVEKKLLLQQISSNLQFIGMDGTNHIDSADERDLVHMLMLADEDVKDDEGGEFINATQDETVPYKFGRLIEFNANDEHRGMPINKPYVCRMSIRYVGTDNERKLND